MGAINKIFQTHASDYIRQFPNMPANHREVIEAMRQCRSGRLGQIVYRCRDCGQVHVFDRSCGNRHCPQCQQHKTNLWLQKQMDKQLPCPYFLITWTLPEEIRAFCRANQKPAYAALFKAAATALKTLAQDKRFIGASTPGFTAILHTWGRMIQYHPHLHCIVPAGGLSKDKTAWLPSANRFYLPVRALSKIYRAVFKKEMAAQGLIAQIDPAVWTKPWNVHCQALPESQSALKYLSRYVFRVAITDARIIEVAHGQVTFSYKKTGSNRLRRTTVTVFEFMRRFLQHVLPDGFMKVRHYGFLNANCAVPITRLRLLIIAANSKRYHLDDLLPPRNKITAPGPVCQTCQGPLISTVSSPGNRYGRERRQRSVNLKSPINKNKVRPELSKTRSKEICATPHEKWRNPQSLRNMKRLLPALPDSINTGSSPSVR